MTSPLYNTSFNVNLTSFTSNVTIIPHNVWYLNAININGILESNDGATYATTIVLLDGLINVAVFNCVFNGTYTLYEIANLTNINYYSAGNNPLTLSMNHADKLINPFYLACNVLATYKP